MFNEIKRTMKFKDFLSPVISIVVVMIIWKLLDNGERLLFHEALIAGIIGIAISYVNPKKK